MEMEITDNMNSSYRLLDEQDISRQIQRYKTKQSENCEVELI